MGIRRLCLAGGVALNCVANGKVLQDGAIEQLWVQPAAGDAGGALGAALCTYHLHANKPRFVHKGVDSMSGSYLGPSFSQDEVEQRLKAVGAHFISVSESMMIERTAQDLVAGHAVGWFQGRMEFGPRALGARSILGDARSPTIQKTLNLRVKYRESFRPFAPSVLREEVANWFEFDQDSPYMLLVAAVEEKRRRAMTSEEETLFGIEKLNSVRSQIPAVNVCACSAERAGAGHEGRGAGRVTISWSARSFTGRARYRQLR
jgi:carbamoyltransferase